MKLWGRRPISAAADWFVIARSGIDASDDARWSAWLHGNDDNMRAYENLELVWELTEELRHRPRIEAWLQDIDARARAVAKAPRRRGLPGLRLSWLGSAVAATLLLAGGAFVLFRDRPTTAEYATAVGEQNRVTLNDGSIVALNTATKLTVRYSRGLRRVELEAGEADFIVSPDAARPFEVHALQGMTTAVGTEFDVEMGAGAATVSVLKGSVGVRTGQDARVQISAGQAVQYAPNGALSAVRPADTNRVRAWQARRLVFNDLPLSEALAEYNRYLKVPIVVGDPALASRRINGVFGIDSSAAFLDVLQQSLHVKATPSPSEIVLEPR